MTEMLHYSPAALAILAGIILIFVAWLRESIRSSTRKSFSDASWWMTSVGAMLFLVGAAVLLWQSGGPTVGSS